MLRNLLVFKKFDLKGNLVVRHLKRAKVMAAEYEPIVKFWYGDDLSVSTLDSDSYKPDYKLWFSSSKEGDDLIRSKFETTLNKAFKGDYEHWRKEARGSLALIILFDQLSRNIYRGSAQMFAYDAKAVEVAQELVNSKEKWDQLAVIQKAFVNLVFEHSEDPVLNESAVTRMKSVLESAKTEATKRLASSFLSAAVEHHEVFKQFGRYPQRNELLGREPTPEETHFMNTTTIGFVKSVKKTEEK